MADKEQEFHVRFALILKARREILKLKMAEGSITCPKCGGTLRFSVAINYNNHVHGRCETSDCLTWME
jgi:hypothetical protein